MQRFYVHRHTALAAVMTRYLFEHPKDKDEVFPPEVLHFDSLFWYLKLIARRFFSFFAAEIFPKSYPLAKKFFFYFLRIFQRNGLKLDKDLIFSGLVQNVYVYRMVKSKKI